MSQHKQQRCRVIRQFVFAGRDPRGNHVEIVTPNLHEIEVKAQIERLSGVVVYHNVKVWPKAKIENGVIQ